MEGAIATALLAAARAPVWLAILLPVLTGLFGLLAGASAAAVVTTSHERNERFRTRMMESAEQVVEEMDAVLETLDRALNEAEGAGNDNYGFGEREEYAARGREILDEAISAYEALQRRLARLLLVHGDPRVRNQAREVEWMFGRYAANIRDAISDFSAGRATERIERSLEVAEERQKFSWMHRNRMLEVFHEEIFRYGTIGYALRQRFGRLRSVEALPGADAGGTS
jgi:hypothetical protein